MPINSRLTEVLKKADEIPFDESSKIIFFSDCHRGDNSGADDFAPNSAIYSAALKYYFNNGYTYIEIGDGDELWENDKFSVLFKAHRNEYLLIKKFHEQNRFYMLFGNHDIFKKSKNFVKKNLFEYYEPATQKFKPLYENIKVHEGLVLKLAGSNNRIFVVHGHQGDLLNDRLWPLSRFIVRCLWRKIEILRRRNLISPARNVTRMNAIENNIMHWIKSKNQMLIAGHTHHYWFPGPMDIPYFNDGCCVYPNFITGIEIENGKIMLVKWSKKSQNNSRTEIGREIIAGPQKIRDFFHA